MFYDYVINIEKLMLRKNIENSMKENKKVALITGGVRGIGFAITNKLSKEGFCIAIADICPVDTGACIASKLSKRSMFIRADISLAKDRQKILNKIKDKFGRIDVLINNAGIAPKTRADILEASEESFDKVLSVNLKGPYFLTQKIANYMISLLKEEKIQNPVIINISSMSAYTSSPARGEYCISKAGVSMMTKLYADRLSGYGINVYEIRPGIIMTDMTKSVKGKYDELIEKGVTPLKRWGLPADISAAVSAIVSGAFPFSTGEVFNIDGGFHLRRL